MELEVRMAYRNTNDPETKWTEFISTTIQRTLECHINKNQVILLIKIKIFFRRKKDIYIIVQQLIYLN